ncbi:hypothetical protein EYF80_016934 [Liparis tanakae]|uniref:Uncharacterized protein n=1 Tax=Liparis tanakae TaxID=230148 RepID=A0A4Z2I6G5_9TELE|nr:hypothetical protein EYF80_016934 [Liparis tanakae]
MFCSSAGLEGKRERSILGGKRSQSNAKRPGFSERVIVTWCAGGGVGTNAIGLSQAPPPPRSIANEGAKVVRIKADYSRNALDVDGCFSSIVIKKHLDSTTFPPGHMA